MKHAIVAMEDKRFYQHRGVDLRGIGRAVWADISSKGVVQGGSTITQQFVKNSCVTSKRTISRKLKEAALAWQLEQRWSKERILTAYLNTIYFGNGAYGIQRAAQTYFNTAASRLTVPQAALLAGIPGRSDALRPGGEPEDLPRSAAAGPPGDARPARDLARRPPRRRPLAAAEAGRRAPPRHPGAGAVLRRLRQAAADLEVRDARASSAAASTSRRRSTSGSRSLRAARSRAC